MTQALAQCALYRSNSRITAPCQLYAVNDQIVSQSHSSPPSPSPSPRPSHPSAPALPQGTSPSPPTPSPSLMMPEEIPLVKVGGIYELPVELNGVLTLHFVLDSGAAEVNIPADVAFTLLRSGTIKDTDFLPGAAYVLADGSTANSPRFLLRSLKIGNRRVTNIAASIGPVSSTLLLGQSFLEKLGAWGIDSQRQVLTLGPPGQRQEPTFPQMSPSPQRGAEVPGWGYPSTISERTLCERLGGTPAVSAIVDSFSGKVLRDARVNRKFAKSDANRLVTNLKGFIGQVAQCPGVKYKGKNMKNAHKNMGVTEGEFNALAQDLVKTLDEFKVPEEEKSELLAALGPTKPDIVAKPGDMTTSTDLPTNFEPAPPLLRR